MSCTYQFDPPMLHVGYEGIGHKKSTPPSVPVSYKTDPGCPYFSLQQQTQLWWTNGFNLADVNDLPQLDVPVTCQPNNSPNPRMDSIMIIGGGQIQTFTIVQDGAPPQPPSWNVLIDFYNVFITEWLLCFWWNPPGPPPPFNPSLQRQIQIAQLAQQMSAKADNPQAAKLLVEASNLIAKDVLKKIKTGP